MVPLARFTTRQGEAVSYRSGSGSFSSFTRRGVVARRTARTRAGPRRQSQPRMREWTNPQITITARNATTTNQPNGQSLGGKRRAKFIP
jgi:hypothetical protein